MARQKIETHKVTKPIQLLAAWLVGLIVVDSSFLGAAAMIRTPVWVPATLAIAAILNVPLFLLCIFILQTRFRPEMQEDTYYSKYLQATTGKTISGQVDEPTINSLRNDMAEANKNTIRLIQDMGENLKSLTSDISSLSAHSDPSSRIYKKLQSLEAKLNISERNVERAIEQVDWKSVTIEINDLVPECKEILNELKKLGIRAGLTFGSSSFNIVPEEKIVGFGSNVDIPVLRVIVKLLKPFGFNKIHYATEPFNAGRIYVGSYIYIHPQLKNTIRIIDAGFEATLNDPSSTLETFLSSYWGKG